MGVEKGKHYIESRQYDHVYALVEQLLFSIGLGECDTCCEDGSSGVDEAEEGEDVEDTEVLDLVETGCKDLEGKELTKENVLELVVSEQ